MVTFADPGWVATVQEQMQCFFSRFRRQGNYNDSPHLPLTDVCLGVWAPVERWDRAIYGSPVVSRAVGCGSLTVVLHSAWPLLSVILSLSFPKKWH